MPEPGKRPVDPATPGQAERLHTLSHDLKNRLGGLWEALRLVSDMPTGAEREELMAFAERNFFDAQRQLERLLDDFAVDRSIRLRNTAAVDLSVIVRKALDNETYRYTKKHQTCVLLATAPVMVEGDEHWLLQLLQAMVSNASKFSSAGAQVEVKVAHDDAQAVVSVTDPGVGLSPTDLEDLFKRYAVLSSRSTAGEAQMRGTLARASEWARLHGGTLVAHSEGAGKGTRFELRLPRKH